MKLIRIDYENAAHEFWDYLSNDESAPIELKGGDDSITVSDERAAQIEAWCRSAPGFADGPAYARTALLFQDDE